MSEIIRKGSARAGRSGLGIRRPLFLWLSIWLASGSVRSAEAAAVERVAVLSPAPSFVSAATAQLLGEFFRQEVAQDLRFQLVPGQGSPCEDGACAVQRGLSLGADRILWCRVERKGSDLVLFVTATHVSAGARLAASEITAAGEDELFVAAGRELTVLLDALATSPPLETSPDRPAVIHEPVERAPVGKELLLEVRVRGGLGSRELYALFQVGGSSRVRYTRLRSVGTEDGDERFVSSIPSSALTSAGLRYYLRVTEAEGDEVARFPSSGWWAVETSPDPNAPVVSAERAETPTPRDVAVERGGSEDRPTPEEPSAGAAGQIGDPSGTTASSPPARAESGVATNPEEGAGISSPGSRRWWWIGGAAVLAGGIVAILSGGGEGDPTDAGEPGGDGTLPPPPEH